VTELALPGGRAARPIGWWGMALFVATEATLFGTIFGTYLYLRSQALNWPPAGVEPPRALWPLVLAGILVLTVLPLRWALGLARTGRAGGARAAVLLAFAVQAGVLAGQLVLFAHDLDRFPPGGSAYASIYFTMLGAHAAHVAAGLLLELWLLVRLAGGVTRYRFVALQTTVLYWSFVAVLTVLVVAVQLSPRL
jgi:heme/copper-type cytochrome/quinol oxidase subunit 3